MTGIQTYLFTFTAYGVINGSEDAPDVQEMWYLIWVLLISVTSGIVFLLNLQLISFHIYLKIRGMTTYQLLIHRRREKMLKEKTVVPNTYTSFTHNRVIGKLDDLSEVSASLNNTCFKEGQSQTNNA